MQQHRVAAIVKLFAGRCADRARPIPLHSVDHFPFWAVKVRLYYSVIDWLSTSDAPSEPRQRAVERASQ